MRRASGGESPDAERWHVARGPQGALRSKSLIGIGRVRSLIVVVTALPYVCFAAPESGSVRVDLALPGMARSFVRLWTVGERRQTGGIATDPSGVIYTTIALDAVALSPAGKELWHSSCAPIVSCSTIATNFDAVFGGSLGAGAIRFSRATGQVECTFFLGLGRTSPNSFIATDSYVVIGPYDPPQVIVLDAASCTERYRIRAPNGEPPAMAVDEQNNLLVVTWDEGGPSSTRTIVYQLATGQEICEAFPIWEGFRSVIAGGRYYSGGGSLVAVDPGTCETEAVDLVDGAFSFGDLRDIGYDSDRNRIYLLTNDFTRFGLDVFDAVTFQPIAFYSRFFNYGLGSLNKMALGNRWAFIPDGGTLDTGRIHVLDLEHLDGPEFATFEAGRVTRLADRIVDGGLLLTQVQRGNVILPDTPLMAYEVGRGDFVGHGYLHGNGGNKYCQRCLTELHWLEVECDAAGSSDWSCILTNKYPHEVGNITLAGLPTGAWNVLDEDGALIAVGGGGETTLPYAVPAGGVRTLSLHVRPPDPTTTTSTSTTSSTHPRCSMGPCDDGNVCTDDRCDRTRGCVFVPNHLPVCDDGDPCTSDEHCFGGRCVGQIAELSDLTCRLRELPPETCGGSELPQRLQANVRRTVREVETLVTKAAEAAARGKRVRMKELRDRATRRLATILKKVARAALPDTCRAQIGELVRERRRLVDGFFF